MEIIDLETLQTKNTINDKFDTAYRRLQKLIHVVREKK